MQKIEDNILYATNKAKEILEIEESILSNLQIQHEQLSESKKKLKYTKSNLINSDLILKRMSKKWWRR